METIYVDVLIVLNIYVNCFLLKITAGITSSAMSAKRCAAAAVYGSLFSLLILVPKLGTLSMLAVKSAAAVTIVILAFGVHGKKRLFKNTAAFFGANFILAGTVSAVYSWLRPDFVHIGNSFFYIDFSLLILILSTAGLYIAVCLIKRLTFAGDANCYKVIIRYKDKLTELSGLADTGNVLTDHFTGIPVIVCGPDGFLPEGTDIYSKLPRGFRLLPCGTVSGSGLMPVFRPDEVLIMNSDSGERKSVNAMIGLGESSGMAIFNPSLLKR